MAADRIEPGGSTARVLAAFPRRALRVKAGRGALGGVLLAIAAALLFGGFLVMLAVEVVPPLRTDFAIRDRAEPAPHARVIQGRCRSRFFLFQDCELTISLRGKDGTVTRKLSYMFVEPHAGNWSAQPMADPARPELVTTDLGLGRLWNRVATMVGWGLLAVVLIVGGILAALRGRAVTARVKALSGQVLRPVPVAFMGWGQGPSWSVRDENGAVFEWPVRKKDAPFVLEAERGLVLALREAPGGPVFPLDEKLRFVDLTPAERAAILAAR